MSRLRPVLGLAVGVVLVVSSAMHSLMGWPGLRGRAVSLHALRAFAAAYALFGAYALATGDLNPFFLIFVVPGVLLFVAASEPAVAVRDASPVTA